MPLDPQSPMRRPRRAPRFGSPSRRDVLVGGMWLSAGVGAAPLLSACGGNDASNTAYVSDYPVATPSDPLTLPIFDDNPPIADGLSPETGGTLRILNYADFINPAVIKAFEQEHDVEVQVTPYSNGDGLLNKLTAPGAYFDVVYSFPSYMSQHVYNQMFQPFNQTYLPNIKNLWPEFQDPWYDQGAQYSVPYAVYSTGIAYRADEVDEVPENGYMMLWDPQYKGKAAVFDDSSDSLSMAMLAWDISDDVNTGDPEIINAARDKLIELISLVSIKTSIAAYETVPNGTFTVQQAWSGDAVSGPFYLPQGESADVLGYWKPKPSETLCGNETISVGKGAEKPVLAHMFINDLLDNEIGKENFSWTGYQPPLTELSAKSLIAEGFIPDNLLSAVVTPEDLATGLQYFEQPVETQVLWTEAFQEFLASGG